MTTRTLKRLEHRAELWQDGMMVACVEGQSEDFVARNINHYALMYGQDGPVEIRYKAPAQRKGAKRKGRRYGCVFDAQSRA